MEILYLNDTTVKIILFKKIYRKAGIYPYDVYKGHWGPITGLNFHPIDGQLDFSDLFLTSSVDWTVKLWRAKVVLFFKIKSFLINPKTL